MTLEEQIDAKETDIFMLKMNDRLSVDEEFKLSRMERELADLKRQLAISGRETA